jgi:DNA-binding beta-propeller fold protein YncE
VGPKLQRFLALSLLTAGILAVPAQGGEFKVSHLYNLSNFAGTIPYNYVGLFVDAPQGEIYVADGNTLRIFNGSGMEVYRFAANPVIAGVRGIAVDEKGDILALNYDFRGPAAEKQYFVSRWNYRGEAKSRIAITGLTREFAAIRPDTLAYRDGRIYLLSSNQMLLVVTDTKGAFEKGLNLADLLSVPAADRASTEIAGFNLAPNGDLLLTVPALYRAFVISPDGKLAQFGKSGSAAGAFGVVSGIAADAKGNYYVADKLRGVVMVFDHALAFAGEFGGPGNAPESLIRPNFLAVDGTGRLYVTQLMNRGVSVFTVTVS